jgi:hypothetical protein
VIDHAPLLDILARAGGGHSFGGGGGGGGGSFGGGGYYGGGTSSFGGGFGLGLGLLFGGPAFLFFLILIAVVSRLLRSSGSSLPPAGPYPSRQSWGDTYGAASAQVGPQAGLAAIQAHDPGFDLNDFLARVQRVFFLVEQAWSDRKPEESRRVMADALWQQHRLQIQQYIDKGQRNVLDSLAVGEVDVIDATSDASFDTIVARILAACADYDIDVSTNKIVRGNRRVQQWSEDWHFQRSAKAVTRPDGGILNDKCPNCGAPLQVDLAGVCSYCHAQIMAGDYDWVLTRISQVL